MNFAASFTITSIADGKLLTVSDTSNYITNDQAIVLASFSSRVVPIYNAAGVLITTINFGATALTATYVLAADLWADATMTLTGISPVANYTKHLIFPFDRITKNLYREALAGNSAVCTNRNVDYALMKADIFFRGAEIAAPAGEGVEWQTNINSAYAFLNEVN